MPFKLILDLENPSASLIARSKGLISGPGTVFISESIHSGYETPIENIYVHKNVLFDSCTVDIPVAWAWGKLDCPGV